MSAKDNQTATAVAAPRKAELEQEVRARLEAEARIKAETELKLKEKYEKKRKQIKPSPETLRIRQDRAQGNVLDVVFTNHLDPKADIRLTYGDETFHFLDGQTYKDIPICVVKWINSRMVPNDSYEVDPAQGQIKRIRKGVKPRCGLMPVDLNMEMVAQMKKLQKQTPGTPEG